MSQNRENEGIQRAIATSHETCKMAKKKGGRKRAKITDHKTYKNGRMRAERGQWQQHIKCARM